MGNTPERNRPAHRGSGDGGHHPLRRSSRRLRLV